MRFGTERTHTTIVVYPQRAWLEKALAAIDSPEPHAIGKGIYVVIKTDRAIEYAVVGLDSVVTASGGDLSDEVGAETP